jgi:hypothetical protein
MFISLLYVFRASMCSSSGESIVSIHMVYDTLCRWPPSVQVWMFHPYLHTRRSPTYSDIYQMSYLYNWFSWWWAHGCSKHVERWNKRVPKRNVRQVGNLQELYLDAQSAKHKKLHGFHILILHSNKILPYKMTVPPRSIIIHTLKSLTLVALWSWNSRVCHFITRITGCRKLKRTVLKYPKMEQYLYKFS